MSKSSSRYGRRAGTTPEDGWDQTPFTSPEEPTDPRFPGFRHGMDFQAYLAGICTCHGETLRQDGCWECNMERDVAARDAAEADGYSSDAEEARQLLSEAPAPAPASPGPNPNAATERQMAFLKSLFSERAGNEVAEAIRTVLLAEHRAGRLTKRIASQAIEQVKAIPLAVAPRTAGTPAPKVPEGRYALATQAGHLAFYQVEEGTGKWQGRTFISQLIGAPGSYNENRLPRARQAALLEEIAKDAQGAAAAYGKAWKRCGKCHAELSDVRSRAAGYGMTCASNQGFWYPTHAEAMAILGESQLAG